MLKGRVFGLLFTVIETLEKQKKVEDYKSSCGLNVGEGVGISY